MAVASKQLALVSIANATETNLYTVPAGFRTIVKGLTILNGTGGTVNAAFWVSHGGSHRAAIVVTLAASGVDGYCKILTPWIVLEPGDTISVILGSGGGYISLSGAELTL